MHRCYSRRRCSVARCLRQIEAFGPVYAVRGNNDLNLPERLELTFEGICVGVIHDSGSATGRAARMRKKFPQARIVVFGHSHIPWNSDDGSLLLFNPGSPTDKRMQPEATFGLLEFGQDGTIRADIVPL
jgi:uncharacterized protein